jgi:hypothetical protein
MWIEALHVAGLFVKPCAPLYCLPSPMLSIEAKIQELVLRGVRRRQIFVRVVSLAGVPVSASVSEIEG